MKDEIQARWTRQQQHQQQYQQRNVQTSSGRMPTDTGSLDEILKEKGMWVSLSDLIELVDARLSKDSPSKLGRTKDDDNGVKYYQEKTTKSAEFKQIDKLIKISTRNVDSSVECLKKHVWKGNWLFELTTLGFQKAEMIAGRSYPAPMGHYRSSNLIQLDNRFRGLCLAVDSREGGGAMSRKTQHEMCNTLDQTGIPYFVGSLSIGDYALFLRDQLCPILVERKSVQDVAMSIHDGRWQSQKHRMYHGQYVFGYGKCRLVFIIEGKLERQQVSHGYVGSHKFKVNQEKFEEEIDKLEEEGFQVIKTPSVDSSMRELARWTQRVAKDVENGTLVPKYTYHEFVEEVRKIPPNVDFSRLAKYHAQNEKEKEQKREKEVSDSKQESTTIIILDDDDSKAESQPKSQGQTNTVSKEKKPACNQGEKKRKISECIVRLLDDEGESGHEQIASGRGIDLVVLDTRFKKRNRFGTDICRRSPMTADPIRCSQTMNGVSNNEAKLSRNIKTDNSPPPVGVAPSAKTPPTSQKKEQMDDSDSDGADYSKWTQAQLKEECTRLGLTTTGSKAKLIEKLTGPRPPLVWLLRKNRGLYVPARVDTAPTANLVAIQILQDKHVSGDFKGGTKDEIYNLAEGLDITKNPYSGGTTQTGPFHYDGWSSMGKLCEAGDPPLVIKKKSHYRLSESTDISGLALARGMHRWAHQLRICRCEELGYSYNL
jgi:ERCC4-type nuclease